MGQRWPVVISLEYEVVSRRIHRRRKGLDGKLCASGQEACLTGDNRLASACNRPDFPGETFRVLKEKEERQYGEYRTRRLLLEAWDRLEGAKKEQVRRPS